MTAPVPVAMTRPPIPMLADGGEEGVNPASDIRNGLLGSLFTRTGLAGVRDGVLPTYTDASGYADFKITTLSPAAKGVRVLGGYSVISRVGEGPYLVWEPATYREVRDTAWPDPDSTNPRLVGVYARVADRNIAVDEPLTIHGGFLQAVAGVPAATLDATRAPGAAGGPPATPAGHLLLGYAEQSAGSAGLTITQLHDWRRSTALAGANRVLLPGDMRNPSAPGLYLGEITLHDSGRGPARKWNGTSWETMTAAAPWIECELRRSDGQMVLNATGETVLKLYNTQKYDGPSGTGTWSDVFGGNGISRDDDGTYEVTVRFHTTASNYVNVWLLDQKTLVNGAAKRVNLGAGNPSQGYNFAGGTARVTVPKGGSLGITFSAYNAGAQASINLPADTDGQVSGVSTVYVRKISEAY